MPVPTCIHRGRTAVDGWGDLPKTILGRMEPDVRTEGRWACRRPSVCLSCGRFTIRHTTRESPRRGCPCGSPPRHACRGSGTTARVAPTRTTAPPTPLPYTWEGWNLDKKQAHCKFLQCACGKIHIFSRIFGSWSKESMLASKASGVPKPKVQKRKGIPARRLASRSPWVSPM